MPGTMGMYSNGWVNQSSSSDQVYNKYPLKKISYFRGQKVQPQHCNLKEIVFEFETGSKPVMGIVSEGRQLLLRVVASLFCCSRHSHLGKRVKEKQLP
jgi:hypothetical protein